MRTAVFTVDVDRDVNLPVNGKKEALSKCHDGNREEVRFDSSQHGLMLLSGILDKVGVKATFFFEGDTLLHLSENMDVRSLLSRHEAACHGVCHEDITGESTGLPLSSEELSKMIDESKLLLKKAFGRDPVGFRAPYQHIDQRTFDLLHEKGFLYDSSLTRSIDWKDGGVRPWKVAAGLWEMPLAQRQGRSWEAHRLLPLAHA
jgi:peptidoglycan/xylan/chitin deacetylase (PgdA/CDA1 family)